MRKRFPATRVSVVLLLSALILSLTVLGLVPLVKPSVNFGGIISSSTTWTKTNSPYILTGPVLVGYGVTLTIEPGVNVNLATYYLEVNGTLNARGTATDKITFSAQYNGFPGETASIVFTDFATGWNEQTRSGSIIENAGISSAQ
jgi:hypothetical protein